jgi:hypothetical protein
MNLEINKLSATNYRMILVASELLENKPIAQIETITHEEKVFDVVDVLVYNKDSMVVPTSIVEMAIGSKPNFEQIWSFYQKSDRIMVFIVKNKE